MNKKNSSVERERKKKKKKEEKNDLVMSNGELLVCKTIEKRQPLYGKTL